MDITDIFGLKLSRIITLLIFSIILSFFPSRDSASIIGFFLMIYCISSIGYVIYLKYLIKFKKSNQNFKSEGEKSIAKYFDKKKIKYIYEKPLKLGSSNQILHPDFFLPEFDIYVEYWGRWDSDFEYKKECKHKKNLYKEELIDLIELYPDNLKSIRQLDWKFTERLLKILKER